MISQCNKTLISSFLVVRAIFKQNITRFSNQIKCLSVLTFQATLLKKISQGKVH
jgi:hypothetical protein